MLPAFMAIHPQVRVVLAVKKRFSDMPVEPTGLVIRVGSLADNDLIAHRLLEAETWLCASPAYLARHGMPVRAADLPAKALWVTAIAISDEAALLPLVLAGVGIAHLLDFLARPLVRSSPVAALSAYGLAPRVLLSRSTPFI